VRRRPAGPQDPCGLATFEREPQTLSGDGVGGASATVRTQEAGGPRA